MDAGVRRVVGQGFLLLLTGAVALVLFEPLLMGSVLLFEAFPERPFFGSLVLLLVGVVCVLCFVGAKMESRRGVRFLSRALLLLFSIFAGLLSLELLLVGVMTVAVSSGQAASLEDYLPLIGGLALVLVGAAGVKRGLGLRARYWIVALVALGVALLLLFTSQASIFLS